MKESRFHWKVFLDEDNYATQIFQEYVEEADGPYPPKFTTEDVAKVSNAFEELSPFKAEGNPYQRREELIKFAESVAKKAFARDIDWFLDRIGKHIFFNHEAGIIDIFLETSQEAGKMFERQNETNVIFWESAERAKE